MFKAAPKTEIEAFITAAPTGVPARRVWFLYELLTGDTLDVPDTPNVAAVDLLDPKAYFTGRPKPSKRHRVRDNLLGFVYVHPFQDGNGRLHRCLIHHVLAERKFTPSGMVLPVSSVMLDRIDDYRTRLQSHSGPLMEFIEWRPAPDRNVEVLNETADLYRYFDCTDEAEFLYSCVKRTVEHDLPHEIDYLRRHDEARRKIMDTVEMPDRLADELLLFIRQNKGTLSKKRTRIREADER